MSEQDCISLLDKMHQLVRAPMVLVRDRLSTHVSLVADRVHPALVRT
ncbi:hypothetical protein ACFWIB_42490 [Streptomyces sp. NPDC127051]